MVVSADDRVVTLRGGVSVSVEVLERLLDLERRGATFALLEGRGFRVSPPSVLTPDDVAFLTAHRHEARRLLAYEADDRHLRHPASPAASSPPPAAPRSLVAADASVGRAADHEDRR